MERILIVEDEAKISEVLRTYLADAGYEPHILDNGNEVVEWVRQHKPSLMLLDLMLPGKNGMDICRDVRVFSQLPIIMVTARVEEIDRLLGLELGADDYVCKPFSPREVVARVKANLRRVAVDAESPQGGAGFVIDELRHTAQLDGQTLNLTRVEHRMLVALLELPGQVLTRDQLLDRMYDDQRIVGDRTVDSHMTNLRRKLQAVRPGSDCIHSIYGLGYKLEL